MELGEIPGIGDKTLAALSQAGITSVAKLLHTYPRTYRTYRRATTRTAQPGDWVILHGMLGPVRSHYKGRLSIESSKFSDTTGSLTLRWFNMPYLTRSLRQDTVYQVMGRIEVFGERLQIVSPQIKLSQKSPSRDQVLVPIYRQMGSLKPWVLREKIKNALIHIEPTTDPLPAEVIQKYKLLDYHQALLAIHQPSGEAELNQAIHRLAWQELYELQLAALHSQGESSKLKSRPVNYAPDQVAKLIASLPYKLTASQNAAVAAILADLQKDVRMTHLLQGEVGSGKTIVAVILAYALATAGLRTLVMAPTEVLATQLYSTFANLLSPLGVEVSLILSSRRLKSPGSIVIGTQALLGKSWSDVGLVIIDEQQRFGVKDREALAEGDVAPHYLMMTATPIPRTLAMTLLSGLKLTRLTDRPAGRLPQKTYLVSESKRSAAYTWMDQEISRGSRVFVVTPLIESAADQDLSPLKSIEECKRDLSHHFPSRRLAVLHGRLKSGDKAETFARFQQGEIDILVATSMVEVGLDVPEANIIVIEDADRFGLSQLHQLRGRVGRGKEQGYCLLFSDSTAEKARSRLAYFVSETNGAKLATYDLTARGAGNLWGNAQHGFFNLQLGNLFDEQLLQETREAAKIA